MNKTIQAFDKSAIHSGNHAFSFDHEHIAAETETVLQRMTLEQKINEIRGRQAQPVEGLYYAGGDDDLGLEPWKMVDGPRGARTGTATAFPVAIARAATFDVDLERRVGLAIGTEVAAKGGNVVLAPTINLLRHPGWGRAQETYSEDPHHTGAMGSAFISGVQNRVLASPKHFALNNLENRRFETSADIDQRTLHEVYLPHFKRCVVEARAASIMTAYNRVNGTYCSEHDELLHDILRETWGFRGFVESDWFLGTRSTAQALTAGLDIEMPVAYRYSDQNIAAALEAGELSEETITERAYSSIYQKLAWQLREDSVAGIPRPTPAVVECNAHVALAREAAEKSIVLLENRDDTLPLRRTGMQIAVTGKLADTINLGDRGSSMVTPTETVTAWQGIRLAAGGANVTLLDEGVEAQNYADYDVVLIVAGLTYREEGEFIPTAQQDAERGELARGGDREDLRLPRDQAEFIRQVAADARKTVVVLQGGSAIVVDEWIDDVDALLMSWYPGQQGGHALAAILFGDTCPSGRLPVSIPKHMDHLPPWDVQALNIRHDLLHGYRWLTHHGHTPAYAFGHGLSYTCFELSGLEVERTSESILCRLNVQNTGSRTGATVVQLYVSCPDSRVFRPPLELKGFARVDLEAEVSATVVFELSEEDLSYFDASVSDWVLEACTYRFQAGDNSASLPLRAEWQP
ncbi:MAG: glycoside hydrolase family 3 C-terminal domain-containing protein [Pseudomonadales bacterium]|nr:glycoside hydrolase family 3 C-terminal domain-containing protein [Pseudomonadales bacterium]MDP6471387.1 glycoside hydrolase family 3 C-terminal domain-containing protein [Pseudomonadales bacterium]MDP6826421.1 glycoside hydrolase family 3 C-terminal domain-containing protein [Pseudomonadales bacterium]MDP6970974.1 glycoside hydrolase family 3 C-terminal domain-containing protein [Pseudomonadales bacterium]